MGSFLRWLVLAWYLMGVCQSQLKNLRPLKGMLNDFDGPRNATEETPIPLSTTTTTTPTTRRPATIPRPVFSAPPPPQSVLQSFFPGGNSGSGIGGSGGFGVSSGSSFGSSGGSSFGSFSGGSLGSTSLFGDGFSGSGSLFGGGFSEFDSFDSSPSIEDSINEGVETSILLQEEQNSRPGRELELSSKFLAAFRRAETEAEEASCVGRALIETTKTHTKSLDLQFSEAVKVLSMTEVDQEMCREILKKKGCKDFKKPAPCLKTDPYRRMDGSCNNLDNPTWGRSMTPFVRYYYPAYENDIDTMRGEGREGYRRLPSARTVSYRLQLIRENPPLSHITLMVMQWGQFVDHDITFTPETQIKKFKIRTSGVSTLTRLLTNPEQDELTCPSDEEGEDRDIVPLECCPKGKPVDDLELTDCRPINVTQDPLFQAVGHSCMRFVRSLIASKGCELGPREQLNQITSFLDGSMVYGSTERVAKVLRKKHGGRLRKTEKGNLLPRNCCEDRTFHCFKAGDTRVNEQPGLTSMHTLWLRVHEQLVTDFASENPHWNDETLYQEARRVVIALIQQTTYREFLPLVVGPEAMDEEALHLLPNGPGLTYDATEDASIANVIATAAFRFGHTLVNDALRASGGEAVPLVGNFENAKVLFQNKTRPSAFLEGLASSNSQAPDFSLVLTLTNKLFAAPEDRIGLDLMSLNIQRGRDHGLPAYTTWRSACNLPTFASFGELSTVMPSEVAYIFKEVYSDVDEIDLFPAALSEFPVNGGLVGPTFACLLGQQFSRLKKGDRFFFQNMMQPKPFTPEQLESISGLSLASVICRHSDIQSLQPSVFRTAGLFGNDLQPCSSYPTLNTGPWKDKTITKEMPCRGVGPFRDRKHLDHWCTINCFHIPSFCPPTHCSCQPNP